MKSNKLRGIAIILLSSTLLLSACGKDKYDKNEEKVKAEMKILNTYVEDRENPDFDKEMEEKLFEDMTEEERAEREVEVELGLRKNVSGEYEIYGIDEDTKSYVADSISKGLAIPRDGKVVKVLNGEEEEIENDKRDDLTVLMDTQRERLERLEVRKGTQDKIDANDVNLKIISALNERKSELEEEINKRKNGDDSVNNDKEIQKRISDLERELDKLENNEILQDKKDKKEKTDKESEDKE